MNAAPALSRGAPTPVLHFDLVGTDVANLRELATYLDEIGRHSLAVEIQYLAARVLGAIKVKGNVDAHYFSWADWDRLMGRVPYAGDVSDELARGIRDLASRIWCGMTGDEHFAIPGGHRA